MDLGNYEYWINICHKSGLEEEACHLWSEMRTKDLEVLDDKLYTEILRENDMTREI